MTARAILKLEVVPVVLLLSRDADTCEDRYTLLYVAVQKEDSVIAKLLLKYSPAELLYTENSVGQMGGGWCSGAMHQWIPKKGSPPHLVNYLIRK